MILGFPTPGESLFIDLNIPRYFERYQKIWEHARKTIMFTVYKFQKIGDLMFYRFGKRRSPTNDEDPFNEILKTWI